MSTRNTAEKLETVEELKQQNELLKKQVDCWLIKMMKVSLAAINKKAEPVESKE